MYGDLCGSDFTTAFLSDSEVHSSGHRESQTPIVYSVSHKSGHRESQTPVTYSVSLTVGLKLQCPLEVTAIEETSDIRG